MFLLISVLILGCSESEKKEITITSEESSIEGEAASFASIADENITISLSEIDSKQVFKVKVKLQTEKQAFFGDYHGSSFELVVLDEEGNPFDEHFKPGASDDNETVYTDLMDMLCKKPGTTRLFTFHYTAPDSEEAKELWDRIQKSVGIKIINFDFYGNYGEMDADGEENGEDEYAENTEENSNELKNTFSNADKPTLQKALEVAISTFVGHAGGLDDFHKAKYEKAKDGDLESVKGVRQDFVDALRTEYGSHRPELTKALFVINQMIVKMGDPEGIYFMGLCYLEGDGCEKDKKKAVELFEKAADAGIARAYYSLGYCYEKGEGVNINRRKAADYYHEAYNLGCDDAKAKWLHCLN